MHRIRERIERLESREKAQDDFAVIEYELGELEEAIRARMTPEQREARVLVFMPREGR